MNKQEYYKQWIAKNKQKNIDYHKDYYLKNKEKFINHDKMYQEKRKQFAKDFYNKHGISLRSIQINSYNALEAFEKAGKICEVCGCSYKERTLTIHHKDKQGWNNAENGIPMNNEVENLMIVCHSCHTKIHLKDCDRKRVNNNTMPKRDKQGKFLKKPCTLQS